MKIEFKGAWVPVLQLGAGLAWPAKNTYTSMAVGDSPVEILMKTWQFRLQLPFCQLMIDLHVGPGKKWKWGDANANRS